jgi:tetratricopeptide (TPR) repeat protein
MDMSRIYGTAQISKALECTEQAEDEARAAGRLTDVGEALHRRGELYQETGLFTQALENYLGAFRTCQSAGKTFPWTLVDIGSIYYNLDDTANAFRYWREAETYFHDDPYALANVYNNYGLIYDVYGEFDKALVCHKKALHYHLKLRDSTAAAYSYNYIANTLLRQGNIDSALIYHTKAKDLSAKSDDKEFVAQLTMNVGIDYLQLRKSKEATACFKGAKKIYQNEPMSSEIISGIYGVGYSYLAASRYPLALSYTQEALKLAKANGSIVYQDLSLLQLSEIYEKMGRYSQALKYRQQDRVVMDSLMQQRSNQRTSDLEAVYNLGRANEEMEFLKQRIKYEQQIRYYFMGGSILLLLVVGLLATLYLQKRHYGRRLENEITERKRVEENLERLVGDLKESLAKVKTLSGLLPICASCKKIRNDKGYWDQLEDYLEKATDATLTHGICPDCAKKYFPEYYAKLPDGKPSGPKNHSKD